MKRTEERRSRSEPDAAPDHRGGVGTDTAPTTPKRAIVISLMCLLVAVSVSLTDPRAAARYSSFVWILAILPVFLLAYYRGWRGATLAAASGMVALTVVELIFIRVRGGGVDWWLVGTATALLVPITIGTGLLSELLRRQRALALEMAYGDPMTNVGNRRWLREAVANAISRSGEDRAGVGLVFLDLVDFKRVNDSYGHSVGDDVLRQLAQRLVGVCRSGDSVARVGGDEFVICCPYLTALEPAVAIAKRTLDALSSPFQARDCEVYIRARVGVAWYPEHADTFDELLSNADPVRAGLGKPAGGEIIVFDPTEDSSAAGRRLLESDLRELIDHGDLLLALQPVVEVNGQRVVGAEALARLDHPRLGVVQAGTFVATARASGLMYELDMRVLEMAVRGAAEWPDAGPDWIAVNVSYESLSTYGFLEAIEAVLDDVKFPANRLVLEVSTGPAIRNSAWITAMLQSARELGIRLALDNFGPRTFSLAYLEDVEADFLKLDRSVVQHVGESSSQERVIRGVIGMARALGMTTTAVGVETPEQLQWLRDNGCALAQGYYTGRPMEPAAWASYVAPKVATG